MNKTLTTVASFENTWEAHIAKGRLESEGIFAALFDEHTVSMNWMYSNAIGGVNKVRAEDLDRARSILDRPVEEGSSATGNESEAGETGGWGACPKCGSEDTDYYSDRRLAFLSWIFIGLPFFRARKRLGCRACGHDWKDK